MALSRSINLPVYTREQGVVRVFVPNDIPLKTVSLTNSDPIYNTMARMQIYSITSSYGNVNLTGRKAEQITIDGKAMIADGFFPGNVRWQLQPETG